MIVEKIIENAHEKHPRNHRNRHEENKSILKKRNTKYFVEQAMIGGKITTI
jgi:hypothetical protein